VILLAVAASGASTTRAAAPPSQADEQAVRQADQAFVNAMNRWDKAALSGLMAQGFSWTDASGRTLDQQQFLRGSAQSATTGPETKLHDYSTLMFVTGSEKTPGAHVRFVRVWVNEAGKWRILLGQQTNIEGGTKKEQATVPAGTPCENPCKTVPYRGTPEQQKVLESWQTLETAVNQRNADEWARHVGDEFVFNIKENGNPLTKADRVATIRRQSSSSEVTDIGAVMPGSMDVRVFGTTAVMRDTQQPTVHLRPYRAMRIWVKRDGRWQLVYSQQTTIQKVGSRR
jgi:hypothetical protein